MPNSRAVFSHDLHCVQTPSLGFARPEMNPPPGMATQMAGMKSSPGQEVTEIRSCNLAGKESRLSAGRAWQIIIETWGGSVACATIALELLDLRRNWLQQIALKLPPACCPPVTLSSIHAIPQIRIRSGRVASGKVSCHRRRRPLQNHTTLLAIVLLSTRFITLQTSKRHARPAFQWLLVFFSPRTFQRVGVQISDDKFTRRRRGPDTRSASHHIKARHT